MPGASVRGRFRNPLVVTCAGSIAELINKITAERLQRLMGSEIDFISTGFFAIGDLWLQSIFGSLGKSWVFDHAGVMSSLAQWNRMRMRKLAKLGSPLALALMFWISELKPSLIALVIRCDR